MSKEYRQSISATCKAYDQICGGNKNIQRVIPAMVDGLKPVARRIMYTLYKSYDRRERSKVADIAGAVTRIHPHGDAAVAEAIAALGQWYKNNACLIDGKGNYGSPMNDTHGAGRYIEARMSEYAYKCFFEDYEQDNVDMKATYNGKTVEPVVLPARYPHALMNGSLGIGYGLSSNIPPYNVKEVLEATIELIKNPNAEITLIPDSPTGCYILDKGEFDSISKTGTGSYTMRAVTEIDAKANTIKITKVPYMVWENSIKNAIISMRDNKATEWVKDQLVDIKDLSNDKNGIALILYLKQNVNPEEFLEKLFKKDTDLEKSYPVNMKMIDNYTDIDYNITSFLKEWLSYRREYKQASYSVKLTKAMEAYHINEILLYILKGDNIERTVEIARSSRNADVLATRLMDAYQNIKISSLQAKTIANMKISALTEEEYGKCKERKKTLQEEIDHLEEVLRDPKYIDQDIINELNDGIKRFGVPRKSKIINVTKKKSVPKTDHVLTISESGLCKKLPLGVSYTGNASNTSGESQQFLVANNRDNILVLDSAGTLARIAVDSIPDSEVNGVGIPISRYAPGIKGKVISVIAEEHDVDHDDLSIVFATKRGFIKRTKLTEFAKIRGSRTAIKINDDDELSSVIVIGNDAKKSSLIIYTNKGNGIRVSMDDIPEYGIASKGLRQITLDDDEELEGIVEVPDVSDKKKPLFFLYATSNGKFKLTEEKYFPIMARKSEAVNLIPLEGKETLRVILPIHKKDKITVYKKSSDPVELDVSDIPIMTRVAKPKKMVSVAKGDYVASIKIN